MNICIETEARSYWAHTMDPRIIATYLISRGFDLDVLIWCRLDFNPLLDR